MKPKVSVYTHLGVKKDGTFKDGAGAVHTKGHLTISHQKGGCGLKTCNCSPGHWITATMPRTKDGVVRGVTFTFKTRTELLNYLKGK